jgi:DHA3 family macrolide efflux protein-like MFS transporter
MNQNWKKKFGIIWSGQIFSLLSSAIVNFSLVWWITKETGSATSLAIATLFALMPSIVLSPFIGVWIDRLNRKMIMIAADSFIAICSIAVALLYYFGVIEVWHIYILLFMRSVGGAFHIPAMQASVPLLAPEDQIGRVSGITQVIQSAANIAGPALGAMLIMAFSMEFIMLTDVFGALIACITLAFVKIPQPKPIENLDEKGNNDTKANSVIKDMIIGIKAIHSNKALSVMTLVYVICVFIFMPLNAMYPLVVFDHFKGGAAEMGIIEVAFGIGMLIGAVFVGINGIKSNKVFLINLSYIIMGITFAGIAVLSPEQFPILVGLILLNGLSATLLNSPVMAIIQLQIAPEMLGRVISLFGSVITMPAVISLMATGIIADKIGIMNAFGIVGILIALLGIICFFIPILKLLDKPKTEEIEE